MTASHLPKVKRFMSPQPSFSPELGVLVASSHLGHLCALICLQIFAGGVPPGPGWGLISVFREAGKRESSVLNMGHAFVLTALPT